MSHFVVDRDRCRKDGICARVCPVHIIQAAPGDFPAMNSHQEALCIGCGQCMAFCPTAACVAPGLDPAQCRPLRHDLQPAAEQVEELIFARRSVRVFKETPLPRDVLLRLLDATRFAPTAKNAQPLRWIVLESRPQTKRLAELVVNWMRRLPQEDANMARACHAEGLTRAWDRGTDVITRDAPQAAVAVAPADWHWGMSDAAIAAAHGADVLFRPEPGLMYAPDHATWVEVPELAKGLCGQTRPVHFRGVCTVVLKLFLLTGADVAVFGQKDWQQQAILRRMARDLNVPVRIVTRPTVREADGLALSSRNLYLTPEERAQAPEIRQGLLYARKLAEEGETSVSLLREAVLRRWAERLPLGRLDYLSVVHPESLAPLTEAGDAALMACAVRMGKARLIDNILLRP